MKTALFLDVDGVLNQYNIHQRIRRKRTHGLSKMFDPFPKKVQRLSKLVKKYNIDVYVFSAWTIKNLQPFLPFTLSGDTRKYADDVEDIMKDYNKCILIDDEVSWGIYGRERKAIPKDLEVINIDGDYGMILNDFKKLERILKGD